MKRIIACLLAGVSLASLGNDAKAQTADDSRVSDATSPQAADNVVTNDAIIVTARRRAESIQDIPLSIQAVTAEQIDSLEINQFEDITALVPGLTLEAGRSGIGGIAALRGINFDARASGSASSVEFYRNDAVVPAASLFQALYDIERIEVLRGPQGTLRGRASPSGSINITTKRPDLSEIGGYVSALVGEDNASTFDGALNLPIVRDVLGVRVAGYRSRSDGGNLSGLNLATGDVDADTFDNSEAFRASVRADPFDGVLLLDFNYENISRDYSIYDQVRSFSLQDPTAGASPTLITSDDRLGIGALPNISDQSHEIFNWNAALNLFGQTLAYVGTFTHSEVFGLPPGDAAGVLVTGTGPTVNDGVQVFGQLTNATSKQEVHEIRLQNDDLLFGMVDYVVGYLNVRSNTPSQFFGPTGVAVSSGQPPFANIVSLTLTGRDRFRQDREESIFGNLNFHLGDRTEISGGIRQIWFKADSGLAVDLTGGGLTTPVEDYFEIASLRRCFGNPDVAGCLPTKKATVYSASVRHEFSDDFNAYASFGTSFRPGNSVIGYNGTTIGSFLDEYINLPDETSESYELGFKSTLLDGRARFNVSAFHQTFSNYPVRPNSSVASVEPTAPATLVSPFGFVTPVDAKITGVEAELSLEISRNFDLGANLTYTDGRFSDELFPCVDLDNDNVPDSAAPTAEQLFAEAGANQIDTCLVSGAPGNTADLQGSAIAEYRQDINPWAQGFVRGLLTWKGSSQGDSLNPLDSVDSYGLLDMFAGVRDPDGAWDITIFARNIFDTQQILTQGESPNLTTLRAAGGPTLPSTSATNYQAITTTPPRQIGVSVSFAFGSR